MPRLTIKNTFIEFEDDDVMQGRSSRRAYSTCPDLIRAISPCTTSVREIDLSPIRSLALFTQPSPQKALETSTSKRIFKSDGDSKAEEMLKYAVGKHAQYSWADQLDEEIQTPAASQRRRRKRGGVCRTRRGQRSQCVSVELGTSQLSALPGSIEDLTPRILATPPQTRMLHGNSTWSPSTHCESDGILASPLRMCSPPAVVELRHHIAMPLPWPDVDSQGFECRPANVSCPECSPELEASSVSPSKKVPRREYPEKAVDLQNEDWPIVSLQTPPRRPPATPSGIWFSPTSAEKQLMKAAHNPKYHESRSRNGQLSCHLYINPTMLRRGFELNKKVIGRGGCCTRSIFEATSAKIRLRGRGSGHVEKKGKEAPLPLMLAIMCEKEHRDNFNKAIEMSVDLLTVIRKRFQNFCKSSALHGDNDLGALFWVGELITDEGKYGFSASQTLASMGVPSSVHGKTDGFR